MRALCRACSAPNTGSCPQAFLRGSQPMRMARLRGQRWQELVCFPGDCLSRHSICVDSGGDNISDIGNHMCKSWGQGVSLSRCGGVGPRSFSRRIPGQGYLFSHHLSPVELAG